MHCTQAESWWSRGRTDASVKQKQRSVVHKLEDMDSSALLQQLHSRLHGNESAPCNHGFLWR